MKNAPYLSIPPWTRRPQKLSADYGQADWLLDGQYGNDNN